MDWMTLALAIGSIVALVATAGFSIGMVLLATGSGMAALGGAGHQMQTGRENTVWKGHEVVLKNFILREELWIDGKRLATSNGGGWLFAELTHEGRQVPVHVYVARDATSITIFVDGVHAGGDPLPEGLALPDGLAAETVGDPRWGPVSELLAGVRDLAADDTRVQEAADRLEARIRKTLELLGHLDAAAAAHRDLAGGDDPTAEVRATHDANLEALVVELRQLHLALISQTGSDGEDTGVGDLLDRIEAEAEVESDDRAEKVRVARQKASLSQKG